MATRAEAGRPTRASADAPLLITSARRSRTLDADDQDSEDPPGDTVAGEGTGPDGLEGAADLGDIGANDGQAHDDVEDAHEWHNFGG